MKIEQIRIDGFKNHARTIIDLEQPNLALLGDGGAGKTSVIEAFRICLGLPTKWGDKNLQRLSPTGVFTVSVKIDGRTFARTVGEKSTYSINGKVVQQIAYAVEVGKLGFDPNTVDLTGFLSLSGQKRAELFSQLLSTKSYTLGEAVEIATGMTLAEYAVTVVGQPLQGDLGEAEGTPSVIVESVRNLANAARAQEKQVSAHYQQLIKQPGYEGEALEVLKEHLARLNKRSGELASELKNLDDVVRMKESAKRSVAAIDAEIQAKTKARDAVANTEIPGYQKQILDSEKVRTEALAELTDLKSKIEEMGSRVAEAELAADKPRPITGVGHIETFASVPATAMDAFYKQFMPRDGENDEDNAILVELVIKPWLEAQREQDKKAVEDWSAEVSRNAETLRTLRASLKSLETSQLQAKTRVHHAATTIDSVKISITSAENRIKAADADIAKCQARRTDTVAEAQKVLVGADRASILQEIELIATETKDVEQKLRTAEAASAAAGQIDKARVSQLRAEQAVKVLDELMGSLQQWRDAVLAEQIAKVTAPLRAALELIYGDGVELGLKSDGTGRSTVFDLTFRRGGVDVPLEMLCGTEMCLVGVAFLAAIYSMHNSPARILTIDAEAPDSDSLQAMMSAIPKLGFTLAVVSTNRPVILSTQDWQEVRFEDAENVKAAA